MKICQIPHVIFQITSQFFFKFCIVLHCHERYILSTFLGQTLHTLHERDQSKWKRLRYLSARIKIHQILVIFETTKWFFFKFCITLDMSWDVTPVWFSSWNFIYFQQKEPIKVQIWWNFTWAVKSLKFWALMVSFCPDHIKFQLKKYTRVISNDTEERCKVPRKTDLSFQIWQEFGEFSPSHSKVWNFYFDELFLSKVCKVSAKKYRGVIFHDSEQWCKIWINSDLVVS